MINYCVWEVRNCKPNFIEIGTYEAYDEAKQALDKIGNANPDKFYVLIDCTHDHRGLV